MTKTTWEKGKLKNEIINEMKSISFEGGRVFFKDKKMIAENILQKFQQLVKECEPETLIQQYHPALEKYERGKVDGYNSGIKKYKENILKRIGNVQ